MTTTDCHLNLHQDAPHGAERRHPAGRPGFERTATAAQRMSVPKLPPGAWQAVVADPRYSAERDDYAESSLELLRGLEVIEWLHVPLPEHRLPFQASR